MTLRIAAALLLLATAADAQRAGRGRGVGEPPDRAALEGEIRRGFARAVRLRVGLTEAQMRQLGPVTQRFEGQRRQLQMEEQRLRIRLQQSTRGNATADSADIERSLQGMLDIQRRRLQLIESEQRELATFMTPLQRARYFAIQEQFRRMIEQRRSPPGGGRRGAEPDRD